MAFNAGSIEATLTLNRNPFTAGLAAARNQARSFANERYEATARISVDRQSLNEAIRQLRSFASNSRQALARVMVDRVAFDRLVRDLREFGGSVYVARARVDIDDANLRNLRESLRDIEVRIRSAGGSFGGFGDNGDRAFSRVNGGARILLSLLPLILPVAGAAITGAIGLLGALTAAFTTAGIGVGAFALMVVPAFGKIEAAIAGGQAEIDKLPRGLRQAATAFQEMNNQYNILAGLTERRIGFAMAEGFNVVSAVLKTLHPLIDVTADSMAQIGRMAADYFGGSHWSRFIDLLTNNMNPILIKLFEIVAYGTRAVFNLTTAFMPMAQWLLSSIVSGMKDFATWTGNLAGDPRFHAWVETAKEALHRFWDWLVATVKFLFEFAYALAPLGTAIMNVLAIIFNGLSKIPPEWLNGIAMGLSAIVAALLLGATGPFALAAGGIVAVAAALGTLYGENERVRNAVDAFVSTLRDNFMPIWETIRSNIETKIIPAWNSLVAVYQEKLGPVVHDLSKLFLERVVPSLHSVSDTITGKLVPAFLGFVEAIAPFVAFFTDVIGRTVIEGMRLALDAINLGLEAIAKALEVWALVFQGDWEGAWNKSSEYVIGLWHMLEGEFASMWESFMTELNEEKALLSAEWNTFWDSTKTKLSDTANDMKEGWSTFLSDIDTDLGLKKGTLESAWNTMWDNIKAHATTTWQSIQDGWNNWWDVLLGTQDEKSAVSQGAWDGHWNKQEGISTESLAKIGLGWRVFWDILNGDQDTNQAKSHTSWISWFGRLLGDGQGWWDRLINMFSTSWLTILNGWNNFWTNLFNTFSTWSGNLSREWNTFWSGVSLTARTMWDAITNTINTALTAIQVAVSLATGRIGSSWRSIANFFRAPIQWVIDVVVNGANGAIGAWNQVMGWIGQPGIQFKPVPQLPFFAQGGPIHGGIPNKDSVPIMTMPGEYVLSKRAIQNMGGLSTVDQIHKAARIGHLDGLGVGRRDGLARQALMRAIPADDAYGRKYAYGGVQPHVALVGNEINSKFGPFAGGIGGVGQRSGASDHPSGHALDFMTLGNRGQGNAVSDYLQANAARLALKYQIWLQRIRYPGGGWRGMEDRGSATANHFDHVHASFLAKGQSATSGPFGGLVETIVSWWSQIGTKVSALFNGIATTIPGVGGPIGGAMNSIPKGLVGKVLSALQAKLESLMTSIFTEGGGGSGGGNVERWRPTVMQALGLTGQPGTHADITLRRMNQESGGNPRAINNWDSNAARGTPSKGLMQVIDPTFARYRHPGLPNDIWDPLANVAASMRYALGRYGSLPAAYNRAGGYNTGGLLRPGQLAYNETHTPEMILNGRTTQDFATLVALLPEIMKGLGSGEAPLIGNLQVTTTPRATAQDIVEEATLAARRARRLGVYSRR